MGMLAEAFNPTPRASTPSPLSDFWYRDPQTGFMLERGENGIALSAETILNCGTVLAAVRFRGDSWAMCPPSTYRKTSRGREEDPTHYSQVVLRNPNRYQTGNRWRHLNGVWMGTWGNAYNEILGGPMAFAQELRPLHPMWTSVADQRADGSLLYVVRQPGQAERRLGQEQILHFRDLSTDGISGVAIYKLIRTVVGIALLAERHAATFLRKGARLSGLLVPSKPLDQKERTDLRESANTTMGGASNTGTFGILPFGVDLKPISNTNREAQFAELSDQAVGAILRFLGVPGVVVGYADKTATYASAEAFFEKGGIKHCVLPIITNVEAEEEKALLLRGDGRQIKHNLDVLLRANTKDRYEALFKAIGGPWMSRNEGRRIEDLNEDPDPEMDRILTPVNMVPELPEPEAPEPPSPPSGTPMAPPAGASPDEEEEDEEANAAALKARARWLAQSAAAQVVRREIAAVTEKAPKYARNPDGWREWVAAYYDRHAAHVTKALDVPAAAARSYCDAQAADLLAGGAGVVASWESKVTPRLAALALGEGAGTC